MATTVIMDVREGKEIGRSHTPYIVNARVRGFNAVKHREDVAAFVSDCDGVFVVYWWVKEFEHVGCFAYRCAHESV